MISRLSITTSSNFSVRLLALFLLQDHKFETFKDSL